MFENEFTNYFLLLTESCCAGLGWPGIRVAEASFKLLILLFLVSNVMILHDMLLA